MINELRDDSRSVAPFGNDPSVGLDKVATFV